MRGTVASASRFRPWPDIHQATRQCPVMAGAVIPSSRCEADLQCEASVSVELDENGAPSRRERVLRGPQLDGDHHGNRSQCRSSRAVGQGQARRVMPHFQRHRAAAAQLAVDARLSNARSRGRRCCCSRTRKAQMAFVKVPARQASSAAPAAYGSAPGPRLRSVGRAVATATCSGPSVS